MKQIFFLAAFFFILLNIVFFLISPKPFDLLLSSIDRYDGIYPNDYIDQILQPIPTTTSDEIEDEEEVTYSSL